MDNGQDIANSVKEKLAGICQFSVDPDHPYYLSAGNLALIGQVLNGYGHKRAIVITDSNVANCWRDSLERGLKDLVFEIIELAPGEESKTINTISALHQRFLDFEADRHTAVVACGGGVVSDIAGLAASTYMRGLRLYLVPTTLLAMVDAAIGGKNGVDLPQGKNLIGTFYLPTAVLADLRFLSTLPEREWGNGLVETLKTAIIGDSELFAALERLDIESLRRRPLADSPNLKYHPIFDVVKRAVTVKSQIVVSDFRENGLRQQLNLGHTLGHALEVASGYALTHGEAVALGMLAALRVAGARDILSVDIEPQVTALLHRWGVVTRIPASLDWEQTYLAIKRDKKRKETNLVMVLPIAIGQMQIENGLEESLLRDAFESLRG